MVTPTSTYDVGDAYRLIYTLTDAAGNPAAATVTWTVTKPDGTTDTPVATNPSLGTYIATGGATAAGVWRYNVAATGALTDDEDGTFIVEPAIRANLYATVEELRVELGPGGDNANPKQLEAAIRAVSREIEKACGGRRFWLDPANALTTRLYTPSAQWGADVADIGSTTGLVVKTDDAYSGAFGTTWTINTDFQLEPLNAAADGGAYSWTRITGIGSRTLPLPYWGMRRPTLQVTARHGFSEIPDEVREACKLWALAIYKRSREAPFGVAGSLDLGVVRVAGGPDREVAGLLRHWQSEWVA